MAASGKSGKKSGVTEILSKLDTLTDNVSESDKNVNAKLDLIVSTLAKIQIDITSLKSASRKTKSGGSSSGKGKGKAADPNDVPKSIRTFFIRFSGKDRKMIDAWLEKCYKDGTGEKALVDEALKEAAKNIKKRSVDLEEPLSKIETGEIEGKYIYQVIRNHRNKEGKPAWMFSMRNLHESVKRDVAAKSSKTQSKEPETSE